MSLKQVKYIQIDDRRGTLYSAGKQSLLVPTTFIRVLSKTFIRLVDKEGAGILISKIGESIGRGYAQSLAAILKKEKAEINKKTRIQLGCNAIFMEAGWGRLKILEIDLSQSMLKVEIYRAPSMEFLKESRYNLERGILTGVYEEITGQQVYTKLLKENRKERCVVLSVCKEIPGGIEKKEEMVFVTRQRLEELVKKRTKELEDSRKALMNVLEEVTKAREKAEEEKNKTLAVITNLVDGLLVFDSRDKLVLINPQAEMLLNIGSGEVLNKTATELENIAKIQPVIILLAKGAEKNRRQELALQEDFILDITIVPLMKPAASYRRQKGANGKSGSLMILHNISREKLIEKIKSGFVSLAAHQLRTPLSAIKWALRMVLDEETGNVSREQRELLERTYQSNERMIRLINDLLNVVRIEEGKTIINLAPANLDEVVQAMINSFREKIVLKEMNLKYHQPAKKLPAITIDREKIEIALANLIDNALNYTPNKGTIEIFLTADKQNVEFTIQDNGVGIPKNQQKGIFSKFFRGENVVKIETEGTGLGMFIAKNIIEAHGGKIWFESEENKGTTFHFTLPINK